VSVTVASLGWPSFPDTLTVTRAESCAEATAASPVMTTKARERGRRARSPGMVEALASDVDAWG